MGFTRLSLYHFNPLGGSINLPEDKKKVLAVFRRLQVLWFCLMSNMFAEEMVPANTIDTLVKLFLSSCRRLCLLTGTESLGSMCSGECVGRKGPKNKDSSPSSSSSENEIKSATSVRMAKKRQRKEILTDSNLPASKNKSKKKETRKRQRKKSPNNIKIYASEKHLKK